jgi:uncharacterized membrane protein YqjE
MIAKDGSPPPPVGLLAALRAFATTLCEAAGTRGSLFAIELREEVERRKAMLVLAALGAVCLHMALLLLTALVVIAFWETSRAGAVGGLAALFLGLGLAAFAVLRGRIAASPALFAATRGELERDLGELRASP